MPHPNSMKNTIIRLHFAAVSLALTAAFTLPAISAEPSVPKPNADQILREACSKLAAAKQFSFKAHRFIDAALAPGNEVPQDANVQVTVERPNKAMAVAVSKQGEKRLYFDGKTFTLFDATMRLYTTVPAHTSIDGMVDEIDREYGFTPPLAEFALSDPYKEFRRQARTVTYLGAGSYSSGFLGLGTVKYHSLKLSGNDVEAELWIGADDHLIKKLVATFVDRPGKPQIKIEFSDWNLAAGVTEADFTFAAPKGAMKIPMRKTDALPVVAKTAAKKGSNNL